MRPNTIHPNDCGNCKHWHEWPKEKQMEKIRCGDCDKIRKGAPFEWTDRHGKNHITYHNTDRECRFVRKLSPQNSSYYHLFLDSEIYRECCYSCPYAGTNRVGDITIGDFWGIQDSYPEYLVQYGGKLSVEKGISCLLVNTAHGEQLTIDSGKNLFTVPVTIDSVIKHNKQLTSPSSKGKNRNVVLFLYSIGGYRMIEHWYIVTQTIKKTILKCYRRMVSALRIARS